jgi:hypothetical protein
MQVQLFASCKLKCFFFSMKVYIAKTKYNKLKKAVIKIKSEYAKK